jgi:hypothetical protein
MTTSKCLLVSLMAAACAAACSKPAASPPPQAAPAAAAPAPAAPAQTQPAAAPPAAAPPAAAPAAAAPAPAGVIASETYSADSALRCDLLEVKRVSGGAVRVKWQMTNTGAKDVYYNFDWKDLYFTDPAENKKYGFLTDTEGQHIADVYYGAYHAGEQKTQWAKFPAPPESSTKITVNVPKVTPFEDVPVSR